MVLPDPSEPGVNPECHRICPPSKEQQKEITEINKTQGRDQWFCQGVARLRDGAWGRGSRVSNLAIKQGSLQYWTSTQR